MNLFDPTKIKGNYKKSWEILRSYLINQAGYKCQVCDKKKARLSIHHVDSCALNNSLENLLVTCSQCHSAIHRLIDSSIEIKNRTLENQKDPYEILLRAILGKKYASRKLKI